MHYLLERGHERIGLITGPARNHDARERSAGQSCGSVGGRAER
jgi:DNA-binding LacI/PurR family transcriptional regulator